MSPDMKYTHFADTAIDTATIANVIIMCFMFVYTSFCLVYEFIVVIYCIVVYPVPLDMMKRSPDKFIDVNNAIANANVCIVYLFFMLLSPFLN
jgi:hypothetical protein